ncbi:unnamed protein product [Prorocentrum cordatum]|uniref:Uncharacterized protein n=1 Tax=Prorocentrum cordatum TaxID=2364126 RepID=A0ABN9UP20_9DINO|nr:unnamed protein product [Polarella glacialis]
MDLEGWLLQDPAAEGLGEARKFWGAASSLRQVEVDKEDEHKETIGKWQDQSLAGLVADLPEDARSEALRLACTLGLQRLEELRLCGLLAAPARLLQETSAAGHPGPPPQRGPASPTGSPERPAGSSSSDAALNASTPPARVRAPSPAGVAAGVAARAAVAAAALPAPLKVVPAPARRAAQASAASPSVQPQAAGGEPAGLAPALPWGRPPHLAPGAAWPPRSQVQTPRDVVRAAEEFLNCWIATEFAEPSGQEGPSPSAEPEWVSLQQ